MHTGEYIVTDLIHVYNIHMRSLQAERVCVGVADWGMLRNIVYIHKVW